MEGGSSHSWMRVVLMCLVFALVPGLEGALSCPRSLDLEREESKAGSSSSRSWTPLVLMRLFLALFPSLSVLKRVVWTTFS